MKKYSSFFKIFFIAFASLLLTACVHDDKYDDPVLQDYQCKDLTATMTIADVKLLHTNMRYVFPENSTAVMEGYVSSTDESGNIYKTIYIQDAPVNPTQGFVISVDAVSTYTKFPQGSKIYIELKGLALGTYGGLVQLGVEDANAVAQGVDAVSRIPEKLVPQRIFRSCSVREEIVPKVLKISEMAANQALLGALIKVEDAEFTNRVLCSAYAPDGVTVDRPIGQGWNTSANSYANTAVVRNSGFAAFANQQLPAGNGDFVGIFSKFNSTYQMYINKVADLADMKNFPRLDGITSNPCVIDPSAYTAKTVAEVKQLFTSGLTQITGNFLLKAKVTANDETGNLFKYIYVEDATGGIRVNINKTNLYQDARFKVGKEVYVKLKDLYVGSNGGEIQLGVPFNGNIGQIAEADVYKHFFDSNMPATPVVATERTITQLTTADVGRWIKIKDLQFIDGDLGQPYASGGVTNRTLEDCSGNKIILRTSNFASFAGAEVDGGKGDVYAILSIFNGTYQLWIPKQVHADLDDPRCDGSVPPTTIFFEGFQTSLTANFTAYDVAGPQQVWTRSNQGTGTNYYAVMNGGTAANEDWLVSNEINLTGYNGYSFSFDSDGRASTPGNPLEVYITENFSGNPSTTTWTKVNAPIDTALGGFAFFNSGKINIDSYANKKIRIAFKYTSTTTASTTWEVDNLKVSGSK